MFAASSSPSSLESSKTTNMQGANKNDTGKMFVRLNYAKAHTHSIQM